MFSIVPWVLCGVLVTFVVMRELVPYLVSRRKAASVIGALPEGMRMMVSEVTHWGKKGPYDVASCTSHEDEGDPLSVLGVRIGSRHSVVIRCRAQGSVVETITFQTDGKEVLDMIGVAGKAFPAGYTMGPRTGARAGKVRFCDRDFDGSWDLEHSFE